MRPSAGSKVPSRPVPSFTSVAGTDLFVRKRSSGGRGDENAADMDNLGGLKVDGEDVLGGSSLDPKAAASVANFSQSHKQFAGAWKPVIDGKVQLADSPSNGTTATNWNASWQSPPLQSPPSSASPKHHGSERPSVSNFSGSSDIKKDDEGNDSDSESRRVPELPEKKKGKSRSQKTGGGGSSSRKRPGGSSNDKEGKRLKRLLRNRVSAQQARERKKAYLIELEKKAKELELRNAELEEKNATLQRENYMLRQIVKNTTMRGGDVGSS